MPLYVPGSMEIDYEKRVIKTNDKGFYFDIIYLTEVDYVTPEVAVMNLGVKHFRQMMRVKSRRDFEVFPVVMKDSSCHLNNVKVKKQESRFSALLNK